MVHQLHIATIKCIFMSCRDGRYVERYCGELVSLLEACLQHELSPRARRSEHPPHAKVAADVMSSIFLVSITFQSI